MFNRIGLAFASMLFGCGEPPVPVKVADVVPSKELDGTPLPSFLYRDTGHCIVVTGGDSRFDRKFCHNGFVRINDSSKLADYGIELNQNVEGSIDMSYSCGNRFSFNYYIPVDFGKDKVACIDSEDLHLVHLR